MWSAFSHLRTLLLGFHQIAGPEGNDSDSGHVGRIHLHFDQAMLSSSQDRSQPALQSTSIVGGDDFDAIFGLPVHPYSVPVEPSPLPHFRRSEGESRAVPVKQEQLAATVLSSGLGTQVPYGISLPECRRCHCRATGITRLPQDRE